MMSGRIMVENGVQWLAGGFETAEVHKYVGTVWRGSPSLARVPKGRTSSPRNARYDETDGVLFGVTYKDAVHDDDDRSPKLKYFVDEEVVLHMTKAEAITLARHLLEAATGSHL